MMKRIISALAILLLSAAYSVADNNKVIALTETDRTRSYEVGNYFSLTFTLTDTEKKDGDAKVVIDVNTYSSCGLCIYGKQFTETELKHLAHPYKAKFSKGYPGTKGMRRVDALSGLKYIVTAMPDQILQSVYTMDVYDGVPIKITIPVYLVTYKKSYDDNRTKKIFRKEDVTVELDVRLGEPSQYVELKAQVDSLKTELENLIFCNNPRHTPTLESQKQFYTDKVQALLDEITAIERVNGWHLTSNERGKNIVCTDIYRKYQELKAILADINIDAVQVKDCGRHKVSHRCSYCSLNFQQILTKLDNIYMKIYNSDNPDAVRSQYASEVKKIETCAKRRIDYRKYQKRVEEFIERIKG